MTFTKKRQQMNKVRRLTQDAVVLLVVMSTMIRL